MSNKPQKIGRLAIRQAGPWWIAHYAAPDTMEDAVLLGSISMKLVEREDRKSAFMDLMRECVGDIIEETIGQRPTWPEGVQPAPEHERSSE